MQSIEATKGVVGYHSTADELSKLSEAKSTVDTKKAHTLEDITEIVQKFKKKVDERKTQLAPLLQELKPLRQKAQVPLVHLFSLRL